MPDREKVIKGLEQFKADFKPFCGNRSDWARVDDALALLRGQDETANDPPFQRHDCGALIVYRGRDVCPNCGKKVKWDEG